MMNINRNLYAFKAILLGLLVAQILSTLLVYESNMGLFERVRAIAEAGYLTVPNAHVVPTLRTFGAAFFGGIFFTLTVGAGLSLFAFAAAWIWDRVSARNEYALIPFAVIWTGVVFSVNARGFSPIVTAIFLFTPLAVFCAARIWMPERPEHLRPKMMIHLITLAVLALMAYGQIKADMFLSFRDHLLLSNPVGMKLNAFYYKYTLYAAEAFRACNKRQMKTCCLTISDNFQMSQASETALLKRMKRILQKNGYLIISREIPADLNIVISENDLILKNKAREILQMPHKDFLRNPGNALKEFSEKIDRHVFLRIFTLYSLLTVPPVLLYVIVYGLFQMITGLFLDNLRASKAAGILCCITGAVLLIPLQFDRMKPVEAGDLPRILASDNWHHRVAALKFVCKKKMEIGKFPGHTRLLRSPHIPERYWLAKSLGNSRHPKTWPELLKLLDDPSFNVTYSAISAIGRRGKKRAISRRDKERVIEDIRRRIQTSDNWYVQMYMYKALRRLER